METPQSSELDLAFEGRGASPPKPGDVRLCPLAPAGGPDVERLRRGVEELARVKDPHVVETYGSTVRDGTLFAVLERVDGEDLAAQLAGGARFTTDDLLRVAEGLGRALRAAHRQNFVHYDLRPAQVLLAKNGDVKLAGLGPLSSPRSPRADPPRAAYLSPEQGFGQPIDIRSNLYSAGAILYEMATGRPPFEGYDSATSLLYQLAYVDPVPPRQHGSAVPKELERAILRCLSKSPADRYADPKDFLQALRQVRMSLSSVRQGPPRESEDAGDFDVFEDQVIGEGGMGTLLRGRQRSLDRPVAIKLIREAFHARAEFTQRFQREAEILARVDHPNVVRVIGSGLWQGRLFYAMELIEGEDLSARQRRGHRFGTDEILRIAEGVASALRATWRYKIIHRDIKPSNILITKDEVVKVADFGLAKSLRDPGNETHVIAGTPDYLSPEQGLGQAADIRSDLYSLGVVLYELASGRHPYKRVQSSVAMIYQHVHCAPAPFDGPARRVPLGLRSVIERCLKKRPEDRFQSPDELLDALRAVRLDTEATIRLPRTRPRLKRALAAVVAALVAGGALLGTWAALGGTSRQDPFQRAYALAMGLGDYEEAMRLARERRGEDSEEYLEALARSRDRLLEDWEAKALDAIVRRDWRSAADAYRRMAAVASGERAAQTAAALDFCDDLAAAVAYEEKGRWADALHLYRKSREASPGYRAYLDEAIRRVQEKLPP